MAAALARQAGTHDEVVLFSSSWKHRLPPGAVPGATTVDARIPVSLLNLAWHRLETPAVERLAGPADVAWSMHPLLMPSSGAAQVVTIHDLFFLDRPETTAREIRRDYAALAARHAARADGVIAISDYTRAQAVARLSLPADRITVCHPGAPSVTPRTEPPPGGPILHVGTVEPRKNVQALIDAYSELSGSRPTMPALVFAGRIEGPAPPAPANVRFLGYVDTDVRERLYREASVLVAPSLDEGFGIPVLEAMTVGVPVVAAARGALPEVVGDAGLLVSGDGADFTRGLASAILRVLDDHTLRRDLADRGIARARTFSWDESARRARAALSEALARRAARR